MHVCVCVFEARNRLESAQMMWCANRQVSQSVSQSVSWAAIRCVRHLMYILYVRFLSSISSNSILPLLFYSRHDDDEFFASYPLYVSLCCCCCSKWNECARVIQQERDPNHLSLAYVCLVFQVQQKQCFNQLKLTAVLTEMCLSCIHSSFHQSLRLHTCARVWVIAILIG